MNSIRLGLYSLLLTSLVGCARQQEPQVVATPQIATPQVTEVAATPPEAPPSTFPFPSDLGGKAVAKAVTPDVTSPLSHEEFDDAPKARTGSAKSLEVDPLTANTPVTKSRAASVIPANAKFTGVKLANPPEKLPRNFGEGVGGVPFKPVLPVAAIDTPRARDVNLPPPAPKLGRPTTDRVPFDDPTSDLGNAVVVGESVKVPLAPSSFLKTSVPDPFELGAQVKPKVPASAEPSVLPVPVNPQRVK